MSSVYALTYHLHLTSIDDHRRLAETYTPKHEASVYHYAKGRPSGTISIHCQLQHVDPNGYTKPTYESCTRITEGQRTPGRHIHYMPPWALVATRTHRRLVSAVLVVGLFSTAVPVRLHQLQHVSPAAITPAGQLRPQDAQALSQLGLSADFYAAYLVTVEVAAAMVFASIAIVVAWRRSHDGMALFTAGTLMLLGTASGTVLPALAESYAAWQLPVLFIRALTWAGIIIFVCLFPDGRFIPRWTRWLAVLWAAYPLLALLLPTLGPPVALLRPHTVSDLAALIWFLSSLGAAVVAQVYRYQRMSTAIQRQQTKWVMFGFVATFLLIGVVLSPILRLPSLRQPSGATTLYLLVADLIVWVAAILVPVSIGMALLHYRLWDADPLINRLLVYGVLSAILT